MSGKWITFDLDGTLMQNPFGAHVFPEIQELLSNAMTKEFQATQALVAEHELRMNEKRYVEAYDWDGIVQTVLEREGVALAIDVEQLVLKHCVTPKVYLLEEEIPHVLQTLKDEGYSLAVATNGFYKYQAPVLQAIGIYDYFDKVITPEMVGTGKPDVGMLKEFDPQTIAAHVGDRIDHDIYLANQLNIPAILINRKLPAELEGLTPSQRAQHDISIELCLQQFSKETGQEVAELLPSHRPTHIICSLNELPACL